MGKQSQLEKVIAVIDGEIAVLELAKRKLLDQQQTKPARKAKFKPSFSASRLRGEDAAAKDERSGTS